MGFNDIVSSPFGVLVMIVIIPLALGVLLTRRIIHRYWGNS